MKKLLLHVAFVIVSAQSFAQKTPVIPVKDLMPAGVQVTITKGSNTIAGKKIDYTTHTGYLDLKNDTGKLVAKIFFTYYKKDGDAENARPI